VLEGLTIGATLAAGELEIAASVRSREGDGRVSFETRIADVRAEDSPISGRLDVFWGDLGFLSLVTPDVGEIAGTVEADLLIAGTVAEPEVQGGARWNDGRVAVPQWGLTIERIAAQADSRDGSALGFRASGWVDDDELVLTGSTTLDPRAGWPTRLALRGESVRAVQLPNVEIYVSPDLAVSAALPNVHVTGTVHIPRARIELSQLPETAVAPSPDAVVHGSEEEVAEFRTLRLTSDLLVTLGDAVQYLGLNLDTMVSGQLRLRRDETRATMATGSLMLAGTYSAYGQTLQLERGQLLFNGPLDDPALDVRAVRTIEEIRAGVELAGTVRAPRTRVFSDPVMSEADALSYLLLGRPVTGTGDDEETATLQTAALAMGLQQALPVVQRIGQSLGLDEFTVQSTDTDAGALMAGKYLSPRVFIRYSYGLFNRIGGLLLRFRVNERLSIETRSGDQKSMDLLYTVEKD
jgi:translocation and assembly module TamB